MKSKFSYPLIGVISLAAAAWAQSAQTPLTEPGEPSQATRTPFTISTLSEDATRIERDDPPMDAVGDLPAPVLPAVLDDSIPLPIAAVYQPGPNGDELVEPAKGDPFFIGFIAGDYAPPADELVDPELLANSSYFPDQRPDNATYAMVMFQKRITDERLAELQRLGCRVLGFHPHYTIKVAVPANRILDVSTLDFVRWIGAPRTWQKIHPAMRYAVQELAEDQPLDFYVNLFESDWNENSQIEYFGVGTSIDPEGNQISDNETPENRLKRWHANGWQQQHLESLGLVVHEYRPDINAFLVTAAPSLVETVAALDFVQFVEPKPTDSLTSAPGPFHDESIPMVGGDYPRDTYDGSTSSIAVVGLVDSGVEHDHFDLNHTWGYAWNCTTEASPWDDLENGGSGHGTHVTGTMLGNGDVEADHTGMAPGLASWANTHPLYSYRRFPNPCSDTLTTILDRMNSLTGAATTQPHVVNHSWMSTLAGGVVPSGTEADARTVDNHVFNTGQVQVWAAGNFSGTQNLGIQASAKNSLTVGNVVDYYESSTITPGGLWTSSGHGPAGDNRWKPNVTAPGRWVSSALANNNSGYAAYSGTSMAAPHVTGAIAQLVDHYPFLQDREPAEIAARLMATAQNRDNGTIGTAADADLDLYGTGRIDVYKAHFVHAGYQVLSWSPNVSSGSWTYGDFTVPAGTTRMVVVMNYNEVAASSGASQALVNNWDLYLDQDPIDPAGNTGEWFAQQSSVDNSEVRILNNPASGPWRWKAWPQSTTSSMHCGVTIILTDEDISPTPSITATVSDSYVKPNEALDVNVNVSVPEWFSEGVWLDLNGSTRTVLSKSRVLADGISSDLSQSGNGADFLTMGMVRAGESRNATYELSYTTEGLKSQSFAVTAENGTVTSPTFNVTVDGTQPGAVSNLHSTDHTVNVWSNDNTITYAWTAATDNLSGIQGYGIFETTGASSPPGNVLDINAVTSYTTAALSDNAAHYFSIRSVDRSDNWDANYVSTGPYKIDTGAPSIPSFANSWTPQGTSTCNHSAFVRWNPGLDSLSGVAGYSYVVNHSAGTTPNTTVDTTGLVLNTALTDGIWYVHVRTIDVAGNASAAAHFGPFTVTTECGTTYCDPGNANSTGLSGRLWAEGSDAAGATNFTLFVEHLPQNQFGYFIAGSSTSPPIAPPGSQGFFCLGGALGRFNATPQIKFTGTTGTFDLTVPLNAIPVNPTHTVLAGETWQFQAWHRDQNPFNTSNFTNALSVTFK